MVSEFAAVFPISNKHTARLLDLGRTVFAKYTNPNKLHKNHRILCYVTRRVGAVAEGTIGKMEKLKPEEAWERYKGKFFLNEDESGHYSTISSVNRRRVPQAQ